MWRTPSGLWRLSGLKKFTSIMSCLRKVEKRGYLETVIRIKTVVGQVIRYAITTGRAERDPTTDLRGVNVSEG
ncbi:hypothetical protein Q427_02835 [Halomonas sp. BC04]|nr:hypothetical protein Q427_02835 [Halomonas sp. BC04]